MKHLLSACLLSIVAFNASARMSAEQYEQARTHVIEALKGGDYAALDAELNGLQLRLDQSAADEQAVWDAFSPFEDLIPEPADAEALLRAWVERYPRSYAAHTALGMHYLHLARKARGTQYAQNTSVTRMDAMYGWMGPARKELSLSLSLSQRPLLSYFTLMAAASYAGPRKEVEANFRAGIALAPGSPNLRSAYMDRLKPRWGGSYDLMQAFADDSAPFIENPSDVAAMRAQIPTDQGAVEAVAGHYEAAEALYTSALDLSDQAQLHCQRAWVRMERQDWAGTVEDLTRARAAEGSGYECVTAVAKFANRRTDYPDMLDLLDAFIGFNPRAPELYVRRGWILHQNGRRLDALKDFLRAADLGDTYGQTMAGKYLFLGDSDVPKDRDRGLALLRAAAEQGDRNAQLSVVQALEMLGRKDEAEAAKTYYAAKESQRAEAQAAQDAPLAAAVGGNYYVKLSAAGAALVTVLVGIAAARRRKPKPQGGSGES